MDNHKGMEREISIRELFWSFLLEWRKIICLAIVFGLLFMGLQYVRGISSSPKEADIEEPIEEKLTESELGDIENIRFLREEVRAYREYLNTSSSMQIDAYNEPMAELQYMIQTDYIMNYTQDILPDYTSDVISMYAKYVGGESFRNNLIKKAGLDISSKELKELVNVGRESNMIYIFVGYPDNEKLDAITKAVKELLSQKESEIQKIGSHDLLFITESQYYTVDSNLVEKKSTILTRIATLNVQLNQLENALTDQQKEVLNSEEEKQEVLVQVGFQKKYIVLGIFAGIFIAGMWIVFGVLFAGKLQYSEEIRSLYGEALLGEITLARKRKRFLSIVDEKLLALKNRRKKKVTLEQQIDAACANLVVSCKQQNITNVYVTGSEFENIEDSLLELLKQKMTEQGIQVEMGGNMFYDAISMKQGGEIGNILFVEQIGKSLYEEIFNELHLVNEKKMKVLGMIVLI